MKKLIITEEQHRLLEGVNEISEINKLVNQVIEVFAEKNYSVVRRVQKGSDDISFNWDLLSLGEVVSDVDSYRVLKDFIENSSVRIIFRDNLPGIKTVKGYYQAGVVNILYGENFKDNLRYQIGMHGGGELGSSEAKWILKVAIGVAFRSTLIHELQHAYDDYRSRGRYTSDKKSKNYYSGRNRIENMTDEDWKIYFSLPHEYWARFSQTVSDVFRDGMDFEQLYDKFKNSSIMRFEYLDEPDKRRLIKALYAYWDLQNEKG